MADKPGLTVVPPPDSEDALSLVPEGAEDRQMALTLIGDLETAGALTPVSLDLAKELPWEQYVALGRLFGRVKRSSSFWVGDWLIFGEGSYGERFAQAAHATGLAEDTLVNYSYVCRNVPKSRRRADLGFGHHQEVAPMNATEQRRWLKKAADGEWSRSELRSAIREANAEADGAQGGLDVDTPTRAAMMETVLAAVIRDAHPDGDKVWLPSETFARVKALFDEDA